MNLNTKYKPVCLSELELEYPKFVEYLNTNKTFIVNGAKNSGKSTIVKLYLKYLNYDYLLLDDYTTSREYIIDKLQYTTRSVFSYFLDTKYVIVIDNLDGFDNSTKELILKYSINSQFIIITNKYLNSKINYVKIYNYSHDYLMNLYVTIYFLETNSNCLEIPEFENICQMFSILEFNINTKINDNSVQINDNSVQINDNSVQINDNAVQIIYKNSEQITKYFGVVQSNESMCNELQSNYKIFFDKFHYEYNDLVSEKNFQKKLYILDKFTSYSLFQNNLIYNYNNIDDLADSYNNLSCSLFFLDIGLNNNLNSTLEYYPLLSIIGTSYKLDSYKIYKENFQIRKKKNFKNNYY